MNDKSPNAMLTYIYLYPWSIIKEQIAREGLVV